MTVTKEITPSDILRQTAALIARRGMWKCGLTGPRFGPQGECAVTGIDIVLTENELCQDWHRIGSVGQIATHALFDKLGEDPSFAPLTDVVERIAEWNDHPSTSILALCRTMREVADELEKASDQADTA